MAYIDYGAKVYENGKERIDKEDISLFDSIPEGSGLCSLYHGVMGDGNIRVGCYKQGIPVIIELQDNTFKKIEFEYEDTFDYDDILFEYKGYKFLFRSEEPYYAQMIEPDGSEWECYYDYDFTG